MSETPAVGDSVLAVAAYRVGEQTYRQEPLSWTQEKWLAEHVFGGADVGSLSQPALLSLLQAKATLLLGIVLIAEGDSRAAKGKAGFAAAQALAVEIEHELTPAAIKEMAQDFFTVNPIANLWLLVDFGRLAPAADVGAMPSGLRPVSVSSPEATSQNETGSCSMPGQETVSCMPAGSSNGS